MDTGDARARRSLAACYRDHQAMVHGIAYDRCGDAVLAEEITAQTFEAAARQFARGDGCEVTAAWLTVVAKRRLVDHWRHMAARSRAIERIAGFQRPWADAASAGIDTDVSTALDSLPARQRTVLTLRYLDDWGLDEIAAGMGLSYRAVESLLARARRSFAAAMRAESGAADDDGDWVKST